MFRTFRHRLLFWFLVFIGFSLVTIVLALLYLNKREAIQHETETIEQAYIQLLKSVESQQYFFGYETKNQDYFQTGNSLYLEDYRIQVDSTLGLLNSIGKQSRHQLLDSISALQREIEQIDSLFLFLTGKVKERGFKDFSLEGAMRDHVHWLEAIDEIPTQEILSLRRHEKDYIIRNEPEYVDKHARLMAVLKDRLENTIYLSRARRDSIWYHLSGYEEKFKQMVALDKLIGIKDNTGLKQQLDAQIVASGASFSDLVNQTKRWAKSEFRKLTLYFVLMGLVLLAFSIFLSTLIAKKITLPLTELTEHITRFVDSNFTLESEHPVVRTKDEIGSLTQNFSHLKDEVINRLRFFKQKVDERTAELAQANDRLYKLSEANSRFVPNAFLDNLGKKGIEDIQLGDHVERHMTVVFTDIREFTKISEALNPQENFEFINTYLAGIVPIIQKHGGFIDKFIGDSVMALFPDDAAAAIKTVFEFEDFLVEFNKIQREKGKHMVRIGTGIHTGHMILGTIGHSDRLETTVVSDAVNTASRIEGLSKYYGAKVIATEATLVHIKGENGFNYRFLDKVQVKGKSKSVEVYEFVSERDTVKLSYLEDYKEGIELIREKKIDKAAKIFSKLAKQFPEDRAVGIFAERCTNYLEHKTENWTEITEMSTK